MSRALSTIIYFHQISGSLLYIANRGVFLGGIHYLEKKNKHKDMSKIKD